MDEALGFTTMIQKLSEESHKGVSPVVHLQSDQKGPKNTMATRNGAYIHSAEDTNKISLRQRFCSQTRTFEIEGITI